MSVILLPDKWRRQPNGPVLVNLDHPLASKISYAIVAGVDLLNPSLSQLTFAENNIYGRVFRGSSPHKVSADTAESTVIGHHYYAGDNNDYAALSWGFYVSAGNNSQLGIGMGPITGSSIYAVNRANGAGSTELEPSITIPYSAIWAITGTLGSGAAAKAYKNGVYFANVAQSGSEPFSQSTSRTFDSYLSSSSGKASAWNYKFNRILLPEEIRELSNAPYQILVKAPRILYFLPSAGGGATGSLSVTLADVTVSASGALSIAGSASNTLAAVGLSGAGAVAIAGSASNALAAATLSASGSVISGISGSLAQTLGAASLTGAGAVAVNASLSQLLADAALSGSGAVSISGVLSQVLADAALSGAGAVAIAGAAANTLSDASLVASGYVGSVPITGNLSQTLGAVTASGAGQISIAGALAQTLGAVAVAGAGALPITGQAVVTLAGAPVSATGGVLIQGSLAQAIASASLIGAGYVGGPPPSGSGLTEEQATMLLELWRLAGLDAANPMTVTPSTRVAGDVSLAITGDPETAVTVARL